MDTVCFISFIFLFSFFDVFVCAKRMNPLGKGSWGDCAADQLAILHQDDGLGCSSGSQIKIQRFVLGCLDQSSSDSRAGCQNHLNLF